MVCSIPSIHHVSHRLILAIAENAAELKPQRSAPGTPTSFLGHRTLQFQALNLSPGCRLFSNLPVPWRDALHNPGAFGSGATTEHVGHM
jgi:hypothetical protein